jgi:peroxiredoxin
VALIAVSASAADVPRKAPDLKIQMPDGSTLPLSKYRGRVIALEFLLTTCPHCQQASVLMNRLNKEYASSGFQALAVSIRPGPPTVPEYVRQFALDFPVGSITSESAHMFLQHPTMIPMMMPQLVFIDREGVIRAQFAGTDPFFGPDEEKNMRKWIESLLKPAGARKAAAKPPVKKTS